MFAITMVTSLLVFLTQTWLLQIFGSEFIVAVPVLTILLISQLVNAAAGPAGRILVMTGHEKVMTKVLTFSTLLLVATILILMSSVGEVDSALATLITFLLYNIALDIDL